MAAGEKHEPVFEGFTHLAKEKEILPKPPKEINTYLKETFWTMVFDFTELKKRKKVQFVVKLSKPPTVVLL